MLNLQVIEPLLKIWIVCLSLLVIWLIIQFTDDLIIIKFKQLSRLREVARFIAFSVWQLRFLGQK